MDTEIKVRTGTPSDVDGMMRLALNAAEDNGLTKADPHKMLRQIWSALNLDHGIVGIIGDPGTEFEGAALLKIEELWYSKESTLIELSIFVDQKFRSAKGGRAARLCNFVKDVQKSLDIPGVVGILSTNRTEAKRKLYERSFGVPGGHYWILGAKTGEWAQ